MNAAERLEFCLRDEVCPDTDIKPGLKVIINPNPLVDNSQLPTGCRYCELKTEYSLGGEIW